MTFTPAQRLPGLTPFLCEYRGQDGAHYMITLHGIDERQVLEDNCDLLPELEILGIHEGSVE